MDIVLLYVMLFIIWATSFIYGILENIYEECISFRELQHKCDPNLNKFGNILLYIGYSYISIGRGLGNLLVKSVLKPIHKFLFVGKTKCEKE